MPQQNYSEKKGKPPVLCTSLYLVSLSFGIGALLIHSGAPWLTWVEYEVGEEFTGSCVLVIIRFFLATLVEWYFGHDIFNRIKSADIERREDLLCILLWFCSKANSSVSESEEIHANPRERFCLFHGYLKISH